MYFDDKFDNRSTALTGIDDFNAVERLKTSVMMPPDLEEFERFAEFSKNYPVEAMQAGEVDDLSLYPKTKL